MPAPANETSRDRARRSTVVQVPCPLGSGVFAPSSAGFFGRRPRRRAATDLRASDHFGATTVSQVRGQTCNWEKERSLVPWRLSWCVEGRWSPRFRRRRAERDVAPGVLRGFCMESEAALDLRLVRDRKNVEAKLVVPERLPGRSTPTPI